MYQSMLSIQQNVDVNFLNMLDVAPCYYSYYLVK